MADIFEDVPVYIEHPLRVDWNGRGAVFMFYTPIALAFMIMLYET